MIYAGDDGAEFVPIDRFDTKRFLRSASDEILSTKDLVTAPDEREVDTARSRSIVRVRTVVRKMCSSSSAGVCGVSSFFSIKEFAACTTSRLLPLAGRCGWLSR